MLVHIYDPVGRPLIHPLRYPPNYTWGDVTCAVNKHVRGLIDGYTFVRLEVWEDHPDPDRELYGHGELIVATPRECR